MPFLRINGLVVPVADGTPNHNPEDIGSRQRSFSGGLLTDRRARKRRWGFTTTPLSELDSKALEGAVAGLGDVWPWAFTDAGRNTFDLFSSKGLLANQGTTGGTVAIGRSSELSTLSGDEPVYDQISAAGAVTESRFGDGSFTTDPAVTNLFNGTATRDNIRDGDELGSTAGFTAVGGSVSSDSSVALQGQRSVEVVVGAATDGVDTDLAPIPGPADYVGSCYVRVVSACTIGIRLNGNSSGLIGSEATYALVPNRWTRIAVRSAVGGADTALGVRVRNTSNTSNFNVDAFQLEITLETPVFPTAWFDGGTRALTNVNLPSSLGQSFGKGDLTISFWMKVDQSIGPTRYVLRLKDSGVQLLEIVLSSATTMQFRTTANDGTSLHTVFWNAIPDSGWHYYNAVIRRNPESGEVQKSTHADGVLNNAGAASKLPDFTDTSGSAFNLGDSGTLGNDSLNRAHLDDITFSPWAASTAQILAWSQMGLLGSAMPGLPRVYVDGDIMPDDTFTVLVEGTTSSGFLVAKTGGVSRNNLRQLDIELLEV